MDTLVQEMSAEQLKQLLKAKQDQEKAAKVEAAAAKKREKAERQQRIQAKKERQQRSFEKRQQEREAYEQLRDNSLDGLIDKAVKLNMLMAEFKATAFSTLDNLWDIRAKEFSEEHLAKHKGNVTFFNADLSIKVELANQINTGFNESAAIGEKKIIEFLEDKLKNDLPVKKLVTSLLEKRNEQLDLKLVGRLFAMEEQFDDQRWKDGITAIKQAFVELNSKRYIRFYKRDPDTQEYQPIVLNFSNL